MLEWIIGDTSNTLVVSSHLSNSFSTSLFQLIMYVTCESEKLDRLDLILHLLPVSQLFS